MNTEKNHGLVTTTNQAQPTPFQRFGTHLKNAAIATAATSLFVVSSAYAVDPVAGGVDVKAAVDSLTALVANVVAIGGAILTVYIAIKGFKMVQKAL